MNKDTTTDFGFEHDKDSFNDLFGKDNLAPNGLVEVMHHWLKQLGPLVVIDAVAKACIQMGDDAASKQESLVIFQKHAGLQDVHSLASDWVHIAESLSALKYQESGGINRLYYFGQDINKNWSKNQLPNN